MELTGRLEGNDVLVIELREDNLDASNVREFRDAALGLIHTRQRVVIDLAGVRFIDSSGLGALVSGFKNSVSHRGRLTLSGLQEQVRSMFELTRLHRVFEIHEGLQDALASFSEGDVHG